MYKIIKDWRKRIMFISYVFAFDLAVILGYIFLKAYLTEGFYVIITINGESEAHWEWFFVCLLFDILIIGLYYQIKSIMVKE